MPVEWNQTGIDTGTANELTPRNVLRVTLAPPHPPVDGHRIHLLNLVRALCAEGWATALVSLTETPAPGEPIASLNRCVPSKADADSIV